MVVTLENVALPYGSPGDENHPVLDVGKRLEDRIEILRPLAELFDDPLCDLLFR